MISGTKALERLKAGNHDFITVRRHERDLSPQRVEELYAYGQNPFAVVLTCSDSRTVPEHMFMMGLGDLFVVRVAGNVVGPAELASVVYACEHLGVKLVLVVGHTHCGAIETTIRALDDVSAGNPYDGENDLAALATPIGAAIGSERDPYRACELNVRSGIATISASPAIRRLQEDAVCDDDRLLIKGSVYHTHSGVVDFLD